MRHRKAGRRLNRTTSHRQAMLRNMVTSLFKNERIRTTDAKAKELRRLADKMIGLAKKGDLHARRQVLAVVREKKVVAKLFDEIAPKLAGVQSGYTRMVRLGVRAGDAAPLTQIELVSISEEELKKRSLRRTKRRERAEAREREEAGEGAAKEAEAPAE